ncbi:hypothetical protein [Arthrobacter sp.]|uniref:hypothetical protein n=1 Tax=Arthrobacter sp. TaxID=1667 RepID=UPI002F407505
MATGGECSQAFGGGHSWIALLSGRLRQSRRTGRLRGRAAPGNAGNEHACPGIYTDPVYTGQASGELNAIGNQINDYAAAHPDTFSGAYFSSDSSRIFVGVAEPGDEAASIFERLADRLDPGRKRVVTLDAQWSWAELDAVKNILVEKYLKESKGGIDSIGLDTSRDTVVISVLIQRGDPGLEDNPTVIEIAERYGDVVMFRESPGPVSLNAKQDMPCLNRMEIDAPEAACADPASTYLGG